VSRLVAVELELVEDDEPQAPNSDAQATAASATLALRRARGTRATVGVVVSMCMPGIVIVLRCRASGSRQGGRRASSRAHPFMTHARAGVRHKGGRDEGQDETRMGTDWGRMPARSHPRADALSPAFGLSAA
jgi:hypothetical protein